MAMIKNINSINHLLHLCTISDSNLVTDCILLNKVDFGRILNSKLDIPYLIGVLKLLVHVYNAETETTKNEILRMTLSQGFKCSIENYLYHYKSEPGLEKTSVKLEEISLIVLYFDSVINILPQSEEYYSKFKHQLELMLNVTLQNQFGNLPMRYWVEDLICLLNDKKVNLDRLNKTYNEINVYPSPVDLFEEKELEPKKLTYKYKSTEEYLDMQFKLLKLDYESIVRDGIWQLKREYRGVDKAPCSLVNLYEDVTVESIEVDNNCRHGIIHVITFSDEDEDRLEESWSSDNKKFMNGSLVYFSLHSQFTTFIIARVVDGSDTTVNHTGEERKAIRVSVIGQPQNLNIGTKYLMLEPTTFFEPYFQAMKAIQLIEPSQYWITKYIANLNFTSCSPNYLQKGMLYKVGSDLIDILDPDPWPKQNLNLNESQVIALKAALSNEFTLIQGPPGTGKTHLIKAIINILVDNKKYRRAPVILVCARNDSLDHVLEALIQKQCKVVRMGGQTRSEIVKSFELSKLNMKMTNKINLVKKIKSLKSELANKLKNENEIDLKHSTLKNHISYYINLCEKDAAKGILSSGIEVIGATTNGAARLCYLLSLVKPEVVIIEEAAEVLESHVVASIPGGCKQVILVGDHKQLQPRPAHINSAEKYNMHVSLFERLIHNGMQCFTLTEQFRMRPEIASLISPLIYETLHNHNSVQNYPNIMGIARNMYFIDHTHPEARSSELFGRWNKHEADILLALADYLVLQGYSSKEITILTGYTAQVAYFNLAKGNFPALEDLEISSIDNFQGEENNIILLSLVRSETSTIGFLKKSFRVNVALSRAKYGLYIIGNMRTLSDQSSLWRSIKAILERLDSIGDKLPLECQKHKTISYVKTPKDLLKLRNGGCQLRCGQALNCGHNCKRFCHPLIQDHDNYICKEQCLRLPCGKHRCKALCYENCEPCKEVIDHELPCGHKRKAKCQKDISNILCRNPCQRSSCGKHKCKLLCFEECSNCTEIVEQKLDCGHLIRAPCYIDISSITCIQPCNRTCVNGHPCNKLCHEECGLCLKTMTVVFCFCFKRTKPCHEVKASKFAIPLQD